MGMGMYRTFKINFEIISKIERFLIKSMKIPKIHTKFQPTKPMTEDIFIRNMIFIHKTVF
jgi:hypothetical protein